MSHLASGGLGLGLDYIGEQLVALPMGPDGPNMKQRHESVLQHGLGPYGLAGRPWQGHTWTSFFCTCSVSDKKEVDRKKLGMT